MQLSELNVLSLTDIKLNSETWSNNNGISTLTEAQKSPDSKPIQDPEISALLHLTLLLPLSSNKLCQFGFLAFKGKILKMGPLIPLKGLATHFSLHETFVFSGLKIQPHWFSLKNQAKCYSDKLFLSQVTTPCPVGLSADLICEYKWMVLVGLRFNVLEPQLPSISSRHWELESPSSTF